MFIVPTTNPISHLGFHYVQILTPDHNPGWRRTLWTCNAILDDEVSKHVENITIADHSKMITYITVYRVKKRVTGSLPNGSRWTAWLSAEAEPQHWPIRSIIQIVPLQLPYTEVTKQYTAQCSLCLIVAGLNWPTIAQIPLREAQDDHATPIL